MSTIKVPDMQPDAAKGAKTAANSESVVLASDGTLPLPAGAATETTLSAINTKTPALGQTTMASSSPVTVASNQTPIDMHLVGESDGGLVHAGVDIFGRVKVGAAFTLADLVMRYEIDTRDWGTQFVTGGSISYLQYQQAAKLIVTGASAASAVLQTHAYYRYQAGKAQWIRQTLYHEDTGQTNQVRRWGYFDPSNGLFFQLSGTTLSVVRRTNVTGTPTDNVVPQSDWNVDKLNGLGPSGVTINITKAQIYEIEFQHLAVGNVAFRVNGTLVHVMRNPNSLSAPYMSTANLPVRSEITNSGGVSTASSLTYICTSVEVCGGVPPPEESFGASSGLVTISSTEKPILAIRPKLTYASQTNRMAVIPIHAHMNGQNANNYEFTIRFNPTTLTKAAGSPTWVSADSRSGVEYTVDADAFTGGQILAGGVINGVNSELFYLDSLFATDSRHLRLDAFGTIQDTLLLTGVRVGNQDASAKCNIHWNCVR